MKFWMTPVILALAGPALAQIETQPLEPLMVPNTSANNWGTGDPNNPSQPLIVVNPNRAPAPQDDPFREGFNDNAFRQSGRGADGGDTFIDRAFDSGRDGEQGGSDFTITTLPAPGESTLPDFDEDEELPRFQEAPFSTRGLFGPDRPRPLPKTATVPAKTVELRTLDKMTGDSTTLTVAAGAEEQIGRLRVAVEGCRLAANGGQHGTTAYLRVWDPNREGEEPVFAGWMFAESPALSALDHPRYDVWVLGCGITRQADADGEEAAPNPDEG